jgi:hypothetical protein
MSENRKWVSYCGLCCKDCIPSNTRLFELVEELDRILTEVNMEKYAEYKVKRVEELKNYTVFIDVLKGLKKLECRGHCFAGPVSEAGCAKECRIRACVIEKHIEGCWECGGNEECGFLKPMKGFHPGLDQNLKVLKEYGIDGFMDKRGKHYNWQL